MSDTARSTLNADEPWPGLASFDEHDQHYFRGRSGEAGELVRLVRREPLTVLFGRSGLGKTSLLKAGLFPTLRADDFLPIYIRLDYAAAAPPLREQVWRALHTESDTYGVQASSPPAGETLWSFFHRRDTEFWSALNRPVTPVIVFDQFEEIFTLGQQNETSHERADEFLAELADLVENRPPLSVKHLLEHDPTAAGRYEFRRTTVKLVLSFREDFLAEMEGLKTVMPSMMINRLRLLPMDGTQAYVVVTEAGGTLVEDEVARRILRLAWKNEPAPPVDPAEFNRMEIDPALLSVVCTELNQKRRDQVPPLPRITPELLSGADREILAGFYERSMAGLDQRVRAFVEEELITDRGYRDSNDWEDALASPGVTSDALEKLIARRLLRAEERQGRRRLELTHDVLTRVVMESRDRRRAREAEAAKAREAESAAQVRELSAERARAAEAARMLRTTRRLLWSLAGLMLVAALMGAYAWQQSRLAAQQTRLAEQQAAKAAALATRAEYERETAAKQRAELQRDEAALRADDAEKAKVKAEVLAQAARQAEAKAVRFATLAAQREGQAIAAQRQAEEQRAAAEKERLRAEEQRVEADEQRNRAEQEATNAARALRQVQVLITQDVLNSMYEPRLMVDGVFGARTASVLRRFQQDAGLEVTGRLDDTTYSCVTRINRIDPGARATRLPDTCVSLRRESNSEAMPRSESEKALLSPRPASGTETLRLQRALNALGYKVDEDGSFGLTTQAALRRFQAERGLPVTGGLDPATLKLLESQLSPRQEAP